MEEQVKDGFLSLEEANKKVSGIITEIKEETGTNEELLQILGISKRSFHKIHKVKAERTELAKLPVLKTICENTGHKIEVFYKITKKDKVTA